MNPSRDWLRHSPAIPGGTKTLNLLPALNYEYLRVYAGFSGNYALDYALGFRPEIPPATAVKNGGMAHEGIMGFRRGFRAANQANERNERSCPPPTI